MSLAPNRSQPVARKNVLPLACLTAISAAALLQTGCLQMANLMHAAGLDMIPAEFDGLRECSVAVVTISDSSQYFNDVAARELNRRVSEILANKVKDVHLVRQDKVEQWRDVNGWDAIDFAEVGQGVKAQKVLGIELSNLRLRDGATLYRGRSDVMIQVIDVETGNIDYKRSIDEFTYPTVAGQYTSETTETRFRKLYLNMLAQEIGRSFHPYDMTDRFAIDSAIASR